MQNILLLSLFISLVGCKLSSKNNSNPISTSYKASCDIQKVTLEYLECTEFYEDFSGNSEALCDDAHARNFLSLMSHHDSSTATACWPNSRVASCAFPGHKIYFYDEGYTAGAAQTECNSLGGTFEQ